ncbi:MAG: ribokinase [Chloroflexi bacterium]|nr:ribokinase [Chloroflexota bacterium]
MTDTVVVGSVNLDFTVRTAELPRAGETVLGRDLQVTPGGKGANQAAAAALVGAVVRLIGAVGSDENASICRRSLESAGVDLEWLRTVGEAPTGVALIAVGPGGENQIVVAPGANARLTPQDVVSAARAFDGAGIMVAQLEVSLRTVRAALQAARRSGLTTVLNPAPATHLSDGLLRLVDILVANEGELALLGESENLEWSAERLRQRGVGAVIGTLGRRGAVIFQGASRLTVRPYRVRSIDTTAAGDAFVGTLAAELARGSSLAAAADFAAAAAALACTKRGAQEALPTRASVEALRALQPRKLLENGS